MLKCESCGKESTQTTPFCAHCGNPLNGTAMAMTAADIEATSDVPSPTPRPASASRSRSALSSSHSSWTQGRFLPGTLIAGRYRIIAMLGKGGMGEVYRADDLSLEQQVALKFLPETATDEATLDRFRNEVRIARRISHPNVCRVYDIGEAEHQIFLSMEYIDGEDLGSLLRRIGRVSGDKAAEIARKLCAGLAAAHAQGVLHRDLKPANIMLNSEGEVMITDFGLAGVATEISDIRSGTPAYMAPEQLTGREVTIKSDIYSLGLVLYELFTGKRAFEGKTYDEIVRDRHDRTPSRPSTLVKDLDPAAESAILHCLEPDPSSRPGSALAVAAALPGGDPLAAALAAGETPSPQLVAAAGENVGLQVKAAVMFFALAIVGVIAFYVIGIRNSGIDKMDLPYRPEVLSQKARDVTQELGYPEAVDSAEWLTFDDDFLSYLDINKPNWNERLGGRPAIMQFVQRQSPENLVATEPKNNTLVPGAVTDTDPAPTRSGMVRVQLDSRGRLTRFEAIPPEKDTSAPTTSQPQWNKLLDLAGLDPSQLKPAEPAWNSLAAYDSRVAWTGVWPGTTYPLRVEAAGYRGRPVFFALMGDWTKPTRMPDTTTSATKKAIQTGMAIIVALLIAGAVLLARRNYVMGRSDHGATVRLAIVVFAIEMLIWVCTTHFVASIGLIGMLILATSASLFIAALLSVLYMAVEPFVRRHWPQAIISWTRLMAGKVRDPHVGRDLLFGVLLGITWGVLYQCFFWVASRDGIQPNLGDTSYMMGGRESLGVWFVHLLNSVQGTLFFFFLMFVLRSLLRKPWLAAIAFVAFFTFTKVASGNGRHLLANIIFQVMIYGIAAFVVLRFGFISLATGLFVADLILNIPVTTHVGSWYAGGTIFILLTVLALAGWGAHTSLGGQKLWKAAVFE